MSVCVPLDSCMEILTSGIALGGEAVGGGEVMGAGPWQSGPESWPVLPAATGHREKVVLRP